MATASYSPTMAHVRRMLQASVGSATPHLCLFSPHICRNSPCAAHCRKRRASIMLQWHSCGVAVLGCVPQ
eukprot:9752461-Alexandrium_andersonii.AAC.1